MILNFFFRHPKVGFSIQRVMKILSKELENSIEINEFFLPNQKSNIKAIFQNGLYANKLKCKINHITGDAHYLVYFLKGSKIVITVHDIMYYHYLSGIKRKVWKWLYIDSLKYADKVVFISNESKNQVLNEVNLLEDKVSVIHNPIDPSFIFVEKEFNSVKPIILHIGTLERKNLKRTILALKGMNCHLRIIGKIEPKIIDLLKANKLEYSNDFNLNNREILQEYINCDIVNFVSLSEGFGMPIIEAQAVGRPVITSNSAPMNVTSGGAALHVNPTNIKDIKQAYADVLNNVELRKNIVAKGLINVKKYNVETIAKKYLSIYKEIR